MTRRDDLELLRLFALLALVQAGQLLLIGPVMIYGLFTDLAPRCLRWLHAPAAWIVWARRPFGKRLRHQLWG